MTGPERGAGREAGDGERDDTGLSLRWLGQAGFALSAAGTSVLIDPWLSPHPDRLLGPPPIDGRGGFSALLATHEHADHLDLDALPELCRTSPGLQIVVPEPLVELVRARIGTGAPTRGVVPGETVQIGAFEVRVTPAWHGVTVADGHSDGGWSATGTSRFVGYAASFAGCTVYHSGDTVLDASLVAFVAALGVDVAILPINGRDFYRERRGSVGNLDAAEALEFSAEIGARTLVPMHYDMARGNTASAGPLVRPRRRARKQCARAVPGARRAVRARHGGGAVMAGTGPPAKAAGRGDEVAAGAAPGVPRCPDGSSLAGEKRLSPGGNLSSTPARAHVDGASSSTELPGLVVFACVAGLETTASLIGDGVRCLRSLPVAPLRAA
jgi:L-ascorbate 6-phosphate lactonase